MNLKFIIIAIATILDASFSDDCVDDNASVLFATGQTCAQYGVERCVLMLCPTCQFAHFCDMSCGYCPSSQSPPPTSNVIFPPSTQPSFRPTSLPLVTKDEDGMWSAPSYSYSHSYSHSYSFSF